MSNEREWKGAAERRLVKIVALKSLIVQMEKTLEEKRGLARIRALYKLVRTAKGI
jgi:hypothetical protein